LVTARLEDIPCSQNNYAVGVREAIRGSREMINDLATIHSCRQTRDVEYVSLNDLRVNAGETAEVTGGTNERTDALSCFSEVPDQVRTEVAVRADHQSRHDLSGARSVAT
jgi:hypothetical protein